MATFYQGESDQTLPTYTQDGIPSLVILQAQLMLSLRGF